MRIKRITKCEVNLNYLTPFQTSYGTQSEKKIDILCVEDELGNQGYGELVAFETPDYIEETLYSARSIIARELVPRIVEQTIQHPQEIQTRFQPIKGNYMAKSAVETAIWDVYAKREKISMKQLLNGTKDRVQVGISLGIQKDIPTLLTKVQAAVTAGYTRVKLKIKPGADHAYIHAVRQNFPELLLMADANSAYSINDLEQLKELDAFDLTLLEQPFSSSDFLDHAHLQQEMATTICLDENIRTVADVRLAHKLGSCRSINLKIPRVGGIGPALDIVNYCRKQGIMVWLGGMFESGIGRALNLCFASQAAFSFPGDISASNRYYKEDCIEEKFILENGAIRVPNGIGLGVHLKPEFLRNQNEIREK